MTALEREFKLVGIHFRGDAIPGTVLIRWSKTVIGMTHTQFSDSQEFAQTSPIKATMPARETLAGIVSTYLRKPNLSIKAR